VAAVDAGDDHAAFDKVRVCVRAWCGDGLLLTVRSHANIITTERAVRVEAQAAAEDAQQIIGALCMVPRACACVVVWCVSVVCAQQPTAKSTLPVAASLPASVVSAHAPPSDKSKRPSKRPSKDKDKARKEASRDREKNGECA
jgi:hypothetical protein